MSGLRCLRAQQLIAQRTAGLDLPERVELEEHLSECSRCTQQARLLGGMRALVERELETELEAGARQRAIDGALRTARWQHSSLPPALRRLKVPQLAVAGAIVAAAAALLISLGRTGEQGKAPAQMAQVPKATAAVSPAAPTQAPQLATVEALQLRIVTGRFEHEGRPLGAGAHFPDNSVLTALDDGTLALSDSRVEASARSVLRIDAAERVLELAAGAIVADVSPGPSPALRVQTRHFRVVVMGTRFRVTPDSVEVYEGTVRVEALDGEVLAAALRAGHRYSVEAEPTDESAQTAHGRLDARVELQRAREHLAAGRVAQARRGIDRVLAARPSSGLQAEALSLRAEAALLEGASGRAIRDYLRVARRFARLPAGENALFAAARLELDRGHTATGEGLLRRYLKRYPDGRFVREAHARLGTGPAAP